MSIEGRTLSIVVPAFNEAATIRELLERVAAVPLKLRREILIVDDGSSDDTAALAEAWTASRNGPGLSARVLRKENGGKGSAVRAGISASTGDYLIIQDADLEYDPNDYADLLAPLVAGEADVVYGSRVLGPDRRGPLWFYLGGRIITLWANLLYGARLTDEPTCYKLFRGDFIRALPLECRGFEFCPEVTAKVLKQGLHIVEVPIRYRPRSVAQGKKIRAGDGLRALYELLRWRF
jgi:dolichol-phosphate mannosyltransferase